MNLTRREFMHVLTAASAAGVMLPHANAATSRRDSGFLYDLIEFLA